MKPARHHTHPRPDTTVPDEAKAEMRGRGPSTGYAHSLREISDILFAKGETDRKLSPQEVQRMIDSALEKCRRGYRRLGFNL